MIINPDNGRPFNELVSEFYDNGQIKLKGRYSGGLANGYWIYFHQNGQMKARGRYYKAKDNKLTDMIEDGRVGKWVFWFNNGTKKMTGIYKNGKQVNTWKYYNKKGKMTTEETYFTCDEKCEESHFPRPCKKEGKVRTSKDF